MWSSPRPLLCNGAVTHLYNNRVAVFSAWSLPRSYLEDNLAVKKSVCCMIAAVKRRLYVCYSYSERLL
jgi:hypothetical protein